MNFKFQNKKRFTVADLQWWLTDIAEKLSREEKLTVYPRLRGESIELCTLRGEILARTEAQREGYGSCSHKAVITLSMLFPSFINTEMIFRKAPVPVAIIRASSLL